MPAKYWTIEKVYINEDGSLKPELDHKHIPYRSAIMELQRVPQAHSPREKLSILLMAHSLMRSLVVDFYKGKEEIYTMDDELPIIMFILLNSKIENLPSELHLVEDFVSLDPSLESDKRLMTNFTVIFCYPITIK